jgi:hypothetical protein
VNVEQVEHRIGVLGRGNGANNVVSHSPAAAWLACCWAVLWVECGYLGQARGEDHNLKDLAYSLHERVHSRSLQDVHLVHLILHLDGNDEVGIVDWLG